MATPGVYLMIRTQISFDPELYARAQQVARQRGISLAELCRRGVEAMIAREPVDRPWMKFAGILHGKPEDSTSIDEVVYGRDRP